MPAPIGERSRTLCVTADAVGSDRGGRRASPRTHQNPPPHGPSRYAPVVTHPLLRGKYRLGQRLGTGGMAEVVAAVNVRTEREVAIKRLLPAAALQPNLVARFEREARAAGRIKSPHVVEILDIDRDDRGRPFLVMERLEGCSLAEVLARRPCQKPEVAIAIAVELLLGVSAAHEAGVIHRDLKPANVFLERVGDRVRVKILDFGISKIATDEPSELTREGETIGTFAYMPPEQIQGRTDLGPPADLWAVGVTLFRMLTGGPPFFGDAHTLLTTVLTGKARRLRDGVQLDETLGTGLQAILDKALAKVAAERYATADEMRSALERVAGAAGLPTPDVALAATLLRADVDATTATRSADATGAATHPRSRWLTWGALAASAAALVALVAASRGAPPRAPPELARAAGPLPAAPGSRAVPASSQPARVSPTDAGVAADAESPSPPRPALASRSPTAAPTATARPTPPAAAPSSEPRAESSRPPVILQAPY